MECAADFVLLSMGGKPLKNGRYKLTDRAVIYFYGWFFKGVWRGVSGGGM
jgi:hypothetical protein